MTDNPFGRHVRRRPLLLALAGGGAALAGVGVAARSGVLSGGAGPDETGVLRLAGGDPSVPTLDLPLTDDLLERDGAGRWVSPPLPTSTFSMVGVTWRRGQDEPVVEVSPRVAGAWGSWQTLPHAHEEAGEPTSTAGTDVAWTGPADGIRVRVSGNRPVDLELVLLRPESLASDAQLDEVAASRGDSVAAESHAARAVPAPAMFGRRDWGANERWRDGTVDYNRTIKQVHVHHTASSNDYRRKDVPALIRGMYAYHTKSLGWSDIGYNFLVDRFGRIWVGRAGGPARAVRGAHTLGFNRASTGVAVIGNFELVRPNRAVIGAVVRVAAWKLRMYHRDPLGTTHIRSEGSDKYRDGRRVVLPVIDGHRDTNDTACPGKYLYAELPRIRRRTKRRIRNYNRDRRR